MIHLVTRVDEPNPVSSSHRPMDRANHLQRRTCLLGEGVRRSIHLDSQRSSIHASHLLGLDLELQSPPSSGRPLRSACTSLWRVTCDSSTTLRDRLAISLSRPSTRSEAARGDDPAPPTRKP